MRELMNVVWILTVFSNVWLCLLLVIKEYYIRFNWLTISAGLSVGIDFILWWIHSHSHHLYEPLRFTILYGFWFIDALIIWEAWCRGERKVRVPVEIQLGLAIFGILVHKFCPPWPVYYYECGTRIVNLLVIAFFITLFRKENRFYEPRPEAS